MERLVHTVVMYNGGRPTAVRPVRRETSSSPPCTVDRGPLSVPFTDANDDRRDAGIDWLDRADEERSLLEKTFEVDVPVDAAELRGCPSKAEVHEPGGD